MTSSGEVADCNQLNTTRLSSTMMAVQTCKKLNVLCRVFHFIILGYCENMVVQDGLLERETTTSVDIKSWFSGKKKKKKENTNFVVSVAYTLINP